MNRSMVNLPIGWCVSYGLAPERLVVAKLTYAKQICSYFWHGTR
jgi:hypothetical protein